MYQGKYIVGTLYSVSYPFCQASQIIGKYFINVFLCLSRLFRCIYSNESPVSSSIIEFARILRCWWYVIYYGVFWAWDAMSTVPTSLYTFFNHIICLVGYLCTGWHRWELPGNYPVLTVVMVIYHYVERILRILVTPSFSYNI